MSKLGYLYRKYLRGSDLNGKELTVEIIAVKPVQVQPHPSAPKTTKYCLWVKGLPEDYPNGILFGPKAEKQLVDIFGNVDTDQIAGKTIIIYPYKVKIAGQTRSAIGFKPAGDQVDPDGTSPVLNEECVELADEIPF